MAARRLTSNRCMKHVPFKSIAWTAGGGLLALASGSLGLVHSLPPSVPILLCMVVTVVVAWRAGFGASIAVDIIATLGLDYFGTEPRFTLNVASPQDVFSLIAFAVVSLLISHLSHRVRTKADEVSRSEAQQRALYELSRGALLIDWKASAEAQLCSLVQQGLHLLGVALWDEREASFTSAGDTAQAADHIQVGFRSDRNYDLPNQLECFRVLRFGVRPIGAMLFRGTIEPLMADAVATLVATHLERTRALKAEVSAESQAVSERLRTAVLDGLAHAVKTPLTTIVVSSSGLREIGSLTPLQDELANVIETQASYLAELTDKLLKTAKLEDREMLVQPRSTNLSDVFETAAGELRSAYDMTRLHIQGLTDTTVRLDPDLFRMILVQVLENALKYSPDTMKVRVLVELTATDLTLSVHNDGSYIPEEEQALIFERYYRSASVQHRAPGTGVGLSVAKHAVEAQGGHIWVESTLEGGTTFHVTLPVTGEDHAPRLSVDR